MTTATIPTLAVAPESWAGIPPLPEPWGGIPRLTRRCIIADPALTLTARERCLACDGEGSIEIEIPGGVYTSNQGGMWVPDSRREACDACDGCGYRTRTRCLACGAYHESDEWGIMPDEPECACEPTDALDAIDALDSTEAVLGRLAVAARAATALGMSTNAALHHVPWPHFLALTARYGAAIERFRATSDRPAFATAIVRRGDDALVALFATPPEGA